MGEFFANQFMYAIALVLGYIAGHRVKQGNYAIAGLLAVAALRCVLMVR